MLSKSEVGGMRPSQRNYCSLVEAKELFPFSNLDVVNESLVLPREDLHVFLCLLWISTCVCFQF